MAVPAPGSRQRVAFANGAAGLDSRWCQGMEQEHDNIAVVDVAAVARLARILADIALGEPPAEHDPDRSGEPPPDSGSPAGASR